MRRHPCRGLRSGNACNPNASVSRKAAQLRRGRGIEKENRRQAGEGQGLHDRGRAGEVVAVEADEKAVRQTSGSGSLMLLGPLEPWRARDASGVLARAGRRPSSLPKPRAGPTPAAGPSGWAMMPPPAVTIRSADSSPSIGARRLLGRLARREDRHGDARLVREHRRQAGPRRGHDALVGLAEFALMPLTCMWSAPARRQIFCQAVIGPAEHRSAGQIAPAVAVGVNWQIGWRPSSIMPTRPTELMLAMMQVPPSDQRQDRGGGASDRFRR